MSRRAAILAAVLTASLALVVTTGMVEARTAPSWLSRIARVVGWRREQQPLLTPSDTVAVFGPKTMSLGAATSGTFVEKFTVVSPTSGGYLLRVTNGPAGVARVTGGTVNLNGAVVFATADLAGLAAGATRDIPVIAAAADTIVATLSGPANSAISVSLLTLPDPTFTVFGPMQFERDNGKPVTVTENFTLPAGAKSPAFLCIRNGELDGSRRNSSSTVTLNGTQIIGPSDLNQQVAGFMKPVTFLQNNVLQVSMKESPGSRLTICAMATDSLKPVLTITAPVPSFITRQTFVDAVGVVVEQTAVKITVNGQPASVTPGTAGQTSFTAHVTLATEGNNVLAFSAIDAAGNRTDSTRTVIRDTQAPVVTLNSLPDSASVRADSSFIVTGSITDLTKITANVNGVALAVDTATHLFSQRITLSSGMNFVTVTATDAAGNATSVVRQITVDNTPPTLTLTGPAEGLVTKLLVAHVTGTATGNTAVSLTVNGVAVTLGANGVFATDVAITEGANTLTVVATNAAAVSATATRHIVRDTQAPALGWAAPLDSAVTKANTITVTGIITDATATTLDVNGSVVTVNPTTKAYQTTLPLTTDGVASITLLATDAAGNITSATRTVTRDATAPVITVQAPDSGQVTQAATLHVVGSVADLTKTTATVNGVAVTVATDGGFAGDISLTAGSNTIAFVAVDAAGNRTQVDRVVRRDNDAPVVSVVSPSDQVLVKTATVTVQGTITDASATTATLNGQALVIGANGSYASTIALSEGPNSITLVATDVAGNVTTVVRSVTLDTTAPVLAVTSPADGITVPDATITVSGTATDQSVVHVTVNGAAVTLGNGGAFSTSIPLTTGANAITVIAKDSVANTTTVTRSVTRQPAVDPNLPPDPRTVAPSLNRTVATTQSAATTFLYTGSNPIQTGVVAGTIVPARVSTLRGRVLERSGVALSGATITVRSHPEYGATKSRADGWYDLVVNGGGKIALTFAKNGYIGAQRVVRAPRQDYGKVDDVVLLKPDPVVTVVQLGGATTAQSAQGSVSTDVDGTRHATVIFDTGTVATMRLPDGTTQPVSTLSVRLTEFTVGTTGRAAMPAPLPPSSAYTYAVEITADEALAVNGRVTFNKPIFTYVENFLGFPVGTPVPLGTYSRPADVFDATTDTWTAQPDGRVIKIVAISGGIASVDANGDGQADSPAQLTALEFTPTELTKLAATYPAGTSLMRMRLLGFYPYDANFPSTLLGADPVVAATPGCASATRDIIKCDVRNASQSVSIPGTPLSLAYSSARAEGAADRTIRVPLTGATVPTDLYGIRVRVTVAGQTTEAAFTPAPNLNYDYTWDGNDAYGRPVQGSPTAFVEVGMRYPIQYQVPAAVASSFGLPCSGTTSGGTQSCFLDQANLASPTETERHSWWRESSAFVKMGSYDAKAQGLGGFDFNVHHMYDPVGGVLYLGDGSNRVADAITPVITTVAGSGLSDYASGDGGPAARATLAYQALHGIAALPDGRVLAPNAGYLRIVGTDGIITRFAGWARPLVDNSFGHDLVWTPANTVLGEGGLKDSTYLLNPEQPVIGTDGTIYLADNGYSGVRLLRITPDGRMTRVAGARVGAPVREGIRVTDVQFGVIGALAVDGSNTLFFTVGQDPTRVYRLGADSVVHLFAGTGQVGDPVEGGQAATVPFRAITSLAAGPDGSLYIGMNDIYTGSVRRISKVTPDGAIRTFIGGGSLAMQQTTDRRQASFGFGVSAIAVNAEGLVYFNDGNLVLAAGQDGTLHPVAGDSPNSVGGFSGDGGPALRARMSGVSGLALGPDGTLLIGSIANGRIRKVAAPMPGFSGAAFIVASADGSELYSFDASGRHLSTYSGSTRKKLFSFEYDAFGRISALNDQHGNRTIVERDAIGAATSLSLPTGQRITLRMNETGDLGSLVAQGKDSVGFTYASDGLLSSTHVSNSPANGMATFDSNGKLLTASNESGGSISISPQTSGSGSSLSVSGDGISPYTFGYNANADGTRTTTAQLIGGAHLTTSIAPDGRVLSRFPDGSLLSTFKEQLPNVFGTSTSRTETLSLPSGLTRTRRIRRGTEGEDPTNIFDVLVTVDSTIVNGRPAVIRTDRSDNTIERTTAAGRKSVFEYDNSGRITQMAWANRHPLILEYDEKGHISAKRTGSRSLIFAVDSLGRDSLVTDANGASVLHTYDGDGRASGMQYTDGRILGLAYDANGQLATVSMTGRDTIHVVYTSEGALSSFTREGSSVPVVRYDYDHQSRPTTITYASGRTVHVDYSSSSLDNAVGFSSGDTIAHHYDPSSMKLIAATRARGSSLTFGYDGHLLKSESWSGPFNASTTYQHDSDFRIKEERVNGASPVTVSYDPDGRLVGAGPITFTRDSTLGNAIRTTLGGVVTENWFSAYGDLDSARTVFGGNVQFKVGVARDGVGRIISRSETTQSGLRQQVYGYDTGGRLADVSADGTPIAHYAYNAAGDRLAVTSPSGIANVTPDREGKILGVGAVTIGYDDDGRRIVQRSAGDSTRIIYDDLDAISTVLLPHGQTLQYGYDASGRRISRTVNGVVTNRWVYRGDAIIAELDASGAVSTRYIYGDRSNVPEGMTRGGRTYKLVQDERGSVRLVVDAATGEIVQSIEYDAFGKVIADSNAGWQPFGFAGGVYEPLTGLEQFGERDYDPATGTFLTRDPALLDGDRAGTYTYAASDPINHTDPSGLEFELSSENVVVVTTDKLTAIGLSGVTLANHVAAYAATVGISEQVFEEYENEIINIEESGIFPNLVQSIQWHHIIPKYLGGAKEGLQIALDSRYHRAITSAFQEAWAYGQRLPTGDELLDIIQKVYSQFPISTVGWR